MPDGTSWRRWAPVLLIVGLGMVPLLLAWRYGATGLVRNDDWSYSEVLFHWVDTGQLHMNGWVSMFLVGQLVVAWPVARLFPDSPLALQVFTTLVGTAGALAAYVFLRHFLSRGRATVAVTVMLVSPMWSPLAGSFMTDVPAAAAQFGCLALGAIALTAAPGRRATAALVGSIAVGVLAATIREYAIVAPIAVVTVVAVRDAAARRRRAALISVGLGLGAMAVYAALLAWRRGLAGSLLLNPSVPASPGTAVGRSALFTVVTAAFLVLPAFAWLRGRVVVELVTAHRWATVAAGSALVIGLLGIVRLWTWSPPLLGPYLDQRGALGDDILLGPSRPLMLPSLLLQALLAVVIVATIALVVVLASTGATLLSRSSPDGRSAPRSSWRRPLAELDARALGLVFAVASMLGLVLAGAGALPVFDRYVLATVPVTAGLVLAHRATTSAAGARRVVEIGAVIGFAFMGLWWSGDSAAFDAGRWEAAERAVALGYPADRIDAGFEWNNVHRPADAVPTAPSQHDPYACVRVEAGPPTTDGLVTDGERVGRVLFTVDLGTSYAWRGPLRAVAFGGDGCPGSGAG
ncbi:MAG: hypothetical protein ACXWA3_11460 [Acidimicrobiales bacterium]